MVVLEHHTTVPKLGANKGLWHQLGARGPCWHQVLALLLGALGPHFY
jgi:hypothetical protein